MLIISNIISTFVFFSIAVKITICLSSFETWLRLELGWAPFSWLTIHNGNKRPPLLALIINGSVPFGGNIGPNVGQLSPLRAVWLSPKIKDKKKLNSYFIFLLPKTISNILSPFFFLISHSLSLSLVFSAQSAGINEREGEGEEAEEGGGPKNYQKNRKTSPVPLPPIRSSLHVIRLSFLLHFSIQLTSGMPLLGPIR